MTQRVELVEAGGGYEILTGTWTAVSGTGVYKGYQGGGTYAAAVPPTGGMTFFREEGYLSKP